MTSSQNGWTVHDDQSKLVLLPRVTGRVVGGDVEWLFNDLCEWFHASVEPIDRAQSWGWAKRPVRGSSTDISNHASGTAIDLNAVKHPLGAVGTFTTGQAAAIRARLKRYGGALRWGGDYSGRKDEMHFEINLGPPRLQPIVSDLRSNMSTVQLVTWRGGRMSRGFAESQAEVARRVPGFTLVQGGWNAGGVAASAGTHDRDAADYSVIGKTQAEVAAFIRTQRECGNAAWFRTTRIGKWGVRAHGFSSYHVHVVPNRWAYASAGAAAQATAYRNGRDGLAGNGADVGPGHVSTYRTRTWQGYLNTQPTTPPVPEEDIMASLEDLRKVIRAEMTDAQVVNVGDSKWSIAHTLDSLRRLATDVGTRAEEAVLKVLTEARIVSVGDQHWTVTHVLDSLRRTIMETRARQAGLEAMVRELAEREDADLEGVYETAYNGAFAGGTAAIDDKIDNATITLQGKG